MESSGICGITGVFACSVVERRGEIAEMQTAAVLVSGAEPHWAGGTARTVIAFIVLSPAKGEAVRGGAYVCFSGVNRSSLNGSEVLFSHVRLRRLRN